MEKWIFGITFFLMVFVDPLGDAQMEIINSGGDITFRKLRKFIAWTSQDFLILVAFLLMCFAVLFDLVFWQITKLFFAYILMRIALFNVFRNLWYGAFNNNTKWYSLGNKWYDRLLFWILKKSYFGRKFNLPLRHVLWFIYLVALIFSLVLIRITF